ncbi:pollen-specific leucine-rich repeat extensin-like protein 1 [Musa acuminata AAA Group]|uniref:pollen-specific leucine-rich repeat extensin-like protein 1 n=1 Tax=Musa acuminata AAA Group TaxID=214697 RepID=UPI0031D8EF96
MGRACELNRVRPRRPPDQGCVELKSIQFGSLLPRLRRFPWRKAGPALASSSVELLSLRRFTRRTVHAAASSPSANGDSARYLYLSPPPPPWPSHNPFSSLLLPLPPFGAALPLPRHHPPPPSSLFHPVSAAPRPSLPLSSQARPLPRHHPSPPSSLFPLPPNFSSFFFLDTILALPSRSSSLLPLPPVHRSPSTPRLVATPFAGPFFLFPSSSLLPDHSPVFFLLLTPPFCICDCSGSLTSDCEFYQSQMFNVLKMRACHVREFTLGK